MPGAGKPLTKAAGARLSHAPEKAHLHNTSPGQQSIQYAQEYRP
jgi:hypothetical protein